MPRGDDFTVIHFVAAEADRGGILTVVRALAATLPGRAVAAVDGNFHQTRAPRLGLWRGTRLAGETINLGAFVEAAGAAWRLRWALARRRRIYHGHSRAGLLVGIWLRLLGCDRVVVSVHCHGRQTWFWRWAAHVLGERIVWLTPAMKVYYDVGGRTWLGCQPNYLIPPSAAAVRARRGGSLRVGGIGALVPWKGWRLMVEALALLPAADRARVTFQHLGSVDASAESAEYARELRARARNLGLDGQITWRGEEVSSAALLGEIDVLLVSSDGEPFSMALLEAWAAGVPVLAADGAGPAELITVRRDGWLFARGSAADLAEMISALLRDEAWTAVRPALPESGPTAARWRALYAEVLG